MFKAEFKLEAITPIFMRGADQSEAEIRPSSIKGLMRWWFRALAGNYFGNDITSLRNAEGYFFGSTRHRSKVIVEVMPVKSNKRVEIKSSYEKYFWFSQVGRYSKPAIPVGETIYVTIKSPNIKAIKISLISLWMAFHLDGFGSRSRKFAGSIFPVEEPNINFDFDVVEFIPKSNLKEYYMYSFKNLITEINKILESIGFKRGSSGYPQYPIFSPETAWVFIGNLADDPKDAIEEIGRWYLGDFKHMKFINGFRFRHADRTIVRRIYEKYSRKEPVKNVPAYNERRPYLGLPIQFYKNFGEKQIKFTVDHWNINRRASSIIFTVNKINKKYYPMITVLKYIFLPNYNGKVRYLGGIYKGRRKIISIGGSISILKKDEDPMVAYNSFYEELINNLKSTFREVFP